MTRIAALCLLAGWHGVWAAPVSAQDDPERDRHWPTNAELRAGFDALQARHPRIVQVQELPGAANGEYVVRLARGAGDPGDPGDPGDDDPRRPALLIVGSLDARELMPGRACLQIARALLADEETRRRLGATAVYIIPVADHAARARAFASPAHPVAGSLEPFDNDRDGTADEDGPRDINGDGVISQMRVQRAGGAWRVSSHDARLMVKAATGETGTHDLFLEGVDDDADGRINEDPAGTVALTHDWAIRWDGDHAAAGRFAMGRTTTRAIAEFLRQHPTIVMGVHLRSLGGALRVTTAPVKPGENAHQRDRDTAGTIQKLYEQLVNEKPAKDGAPDPGPGSFETWLHEAEGAIALTAHLFAVPQPEKKDGGDGNGEDGQPGQPKADGPSDAEQAELAWLAYRPADHLAWKPFDHPQLGKVEIGGWRLDARHDPGPDDAAAREAAAKHATLLAGLLGRFPRVRVARTEVDSRGAGLYRVRLTVHNAGQLDMRTDFAATWRIGRVSRALFVGIHDTPDVEMISGTRRQKVNNLLAGEAVRFEWLVRARNADSKLSFTIETGIADPLHHEIDLDKCTLLRTDD